MEATTLTALKEPVSHALSMEKAVRRIYCHTNTIENAFRPVYRHAVSMEEITRSYGLCGALSLAGTRLVTLLIGLIFRLNSFLLFPSPILLSAFRLQSHPSGG